MCEDLSDISIANIPEQAITIQEDYKSIEESRSRARGGVGYKKRWRDVDEEEMPSEIFGDLCGATLGGRRTRQPGGNHSTGNGSSMNPSAAPISLVTHCSDSRRIERHLS